MVSWFSVLILCLVSVFWFFVLILCLDSVFWFSVFSECLDLVSWFSVLIQYRDYVSWFSVLGSRRHEPTASGRWSRWGVQEQEQKQGRRTRTQRKQEGGTHTLTGQRALQGNREFHISKDRKANTAKDEHWNKCNYTESGTLRWNLYLFISAQSMLEPFV